MELPSREMCVFWISVGTFVFKEKKQVVQEERKRKRGMKKDEEMHNFGGTFDGIRSFKLQ